MKEYVYRGSPARANRVLLACMAFNFALLFGAAQLFARFPIAYEGKLFILLTCEILAVGVPCLIERLSAHRQGYSLKSLFGGGGEQKISPRYLAYVVIFAALAYFAATYALFGIRGILQYCTKELAVKQLPLFGNWWQIALSVLCLAAVPALTREFLNKKIVAESYSKTSAALSFMLPVLFSCVFFSGAETLLVRFAYGICSMVVYCRTKNFWYSALFTFAVVLPETVTGGGAYLPFDYRSTLSLEESLMNGLFSAGIACFCTCLLCFWVFLFFRRPVGNGERVRMTYIDRVSAVLVPVFYVSLLLLNALLNSFGII